MTSVQHRIGRYTLFCRLASGGMANLYMGRLMGSDGFTKVIALKIIHEHLSEDNNFVKMFINEARLASRISHPSVVQTIELGLVGKTHFIAMEYVNGESVGSLLQRSRPALTYCARIVSNAAAGLHAAHELRGSDGEPLHVVHRDVSPPNILISYDGSVKVVDFGVARARGNLHVTRAGLVKGKFSYMAPEQLRREMHVDHRADIFALGIVLYEMTTGRRLFKGDTEAEIVSEVLSGVIPLPSEVDANYPRSLERIVMRALERNPDFRFQSALEFQEALERFIMDAGEPVMPAQLGQLMHRVFADRIEQKKDLLLKCERGDDPMALNVALDADPYPATPSIIVPSRFRRPVQMVGGLLGLIGLAALALLLFLWYTDGADSTANTTVSASDVQKPAVDSRAPASISIAIQATPASATIVFDGKPVTNPFEMLQAPGRGEIEAVVSAPGYIAERVKISLAEGGRWVIALQPQAAVKKRAPIQKRGKIKRKRRVLGDDDVLINPYNR